MTDTSAIPSDLPPGVPLGQGFIPLTVALSVDPITTGTVYVHVDTIGTILVPPPLSAIEELEGASQPGAQVGLRGENNGFSVLETPAEVFELIERAKVMQR